MPLTLATNAQLRARMQNPSLDDGTASQAIADASALVRAVSGQTYDLVTNDVVDLAGHKYEIVLPQRPLVVDNSHPLTVQESRYNLLFSPALLEGYNYRRLGTVLRRLYRPWSHTVRVTYSHGYTTVPDWLNSLVLDAAIAYCTNPLGLRSESVGQITQVWAKESITNATDTIAEMVRSRLRMIGERSGAFTAAPTR